MPSPRALSVMWIALLSVGVRPGAAQIDPSPEAIDQEGEVAQGELDSYEPAQNLDEALRLALEAIREVEKNATGSEEYIARAEFYQQEAVRFAPYNLKAEYIAGRMNRMIGRDRDAFSQISKYLRTPEGQVDWEAWKILGDLHFSGRYYVQAEGKYRRAAELAPTEASIFVAWASNCIKRSQREDAVINARKAIKMDPAITGGYTVLAQALKEMGLLDEAVTAAKDALAQLADDLQDRPGDLQLLYLAHSQHLELQQTLRSLMKKQPKLASAYLDYNDSITESTRLDGAVKMHEMHASCANGIAATQPDTPPELLRQFVEYSVALGKQAEDIEVLESYLELNPGNPIAMEGLDKLRDSMNAKDATAAVSTPSIPLP